MYGTIIMDVTLQLFNKQQFQYPLTKDDVVIQREGYVIIKQKEGHN